MLFNLVWKKYTHLKLLTVAFNNKNNNAETKCDFVQYVLCEIYLQDNYDGLNHIKKPAELASW